MWQWRNSKEKERLKENGRQMVHLLLLIYIGVMYMFDIYIMYYWC